MYIITIANQKGGIGKTATAAALVAGLHKEGKKAVALELDPQANLAYTLGVTPRTSIKEFLTGKAKPQDVIIATDAGDIIPAGHDLANFDKTIGTIKKAILRLPAIYDYCIIDTPPNLGTLMLGALAASNAVIIPAKADPYSIQALGELMGTIDAIKEKENNKLEVMGLLITCYNSRSILRRECAEALHKAAERAGIKVFNTPIRNGIAIQEAAALHVSIFDYAPKAKPTQDYNELVKEVLRHG